MKIFYSYKITSLCIITICLFIFSSLQAADLSITTGGKKGTYFQIGSDIAKLVRQHGMRIEVQTSKGSLENIVKIEEKPYRQIGIVQSDILDYLRTARDYRMRAAGEKIKMIAPLYNEEVHILAPQSIKGLSQLNGKKISIGPERSGTAITASILFKKSNIKPKKILHLNAEKALEALRSQEIDAMIYVSGYPVSLFSQLNRTDNLHLVPVLDRRIGGSYIMSCIPEGTYAWQKGIVSTIAVKAVLAGYDYNEKKQYSKEVCEIGKIIHSNIDWLKRNGHSKWGNVRLDDNLTGWEKNKCIDSAITTLSSAKI
jgi:hypothetical protein